MFRYFVGFALQHQHAYRNMRVRLALAGRLSRLFNLVAQPFTWVAYQRAKKVGLVEYLHGSSPAR